MSNNFARVTEAHDCLALEMTPCAGLLHRFLLRRRPAGKLQEFEISEFTEWTATRRKRPYSIRHVQRAFHELAELGAVEVVKRYTGQIFKLIAKHPATDENVAFKDLNVGSGTQMSKIEPSNAHSSVPTNREIYKETTDIDPPIHPVNGINREALSATAQDWDRKADTDVDVDVEQQEMLEEVKCAIAPHFLNPQLQKVVLQHSAERVQQAVTALKEAKQKGTVRNLSGWLVKAVRQGWRPSSSFKRQSSEPALGQNQRTQTETGRAPSGFREWYDLAHRLKLVSCSQMIAGQIKVLSANQWIDWEEMASAFTLKYMQQMLEVDF
ncbi:MAG: hypothetical protein ACTS2F_30290 [Thainema sp.]